MCENGGTCIDTYHGYVCECPSTFIGKNCQLHKDSEYFSYRFNLSNHKILKKASTHATKTTAPRMAHAVSTPMATRTTVCVIPTMLVIFAKLVSPFISNETLFIAYFNHSWVSRTLNMFQSNNQLIMLI